MVKVRFNGQILTHAKSADQQDYTLCGLDCQLKFDIHGDNNSADIGYCLPLIVHDKINCPQCISIIKHCASYNAGQIKREEMKWAK